MNAQDVFGNIREPSVLKRVSFGWISTFSGSVFYVFALYSPSSGPFPCSLWCWSCRPGKRQHLALAPCKGMLSPPLLFSRKQWTRQSFQIFAVIPFFQALLPSSHAQVVWPKLSILCVNFTCQWSDCFIAVGLANSNVQSLNLFPWLACYFIFLSCHTACMSFCWVIYAELLTILIYKGLIHTWV